MNDAANSTERIAIALENLVSTLHELNRPRLFFDIVPSPKETNILLVTLRNSGRTPAYDIDCSYDPDLPYTRDGPLSKISVFKKLPFLEQGQKIEFFFSGLIEFMGKADSPRQFTARITYKDYSGKTYDESRLVNIERYLGILTTPKKDITDIHKVLENIRVELRSLRPQNTGSILRSVSHE